MAIRMHVGVRRKLIFFAHAVQLVKVKIREVKARLSFRNFVKGGGGGAKVVIVKLRGDNNKSIQHILSAV